MRPTKTEISLRIYAIWSESSLSKKLCILRYPKVAQCRLHSLIRIFAWNTYPTVCFLTLGLNCTFAFQIRWCRIRHVKTTSLSFVVVSSRITFTITFVLECTEWHFAVSLMGWLSGTDLAHSQSTKRKGVLEHAQNAQIQISPHAPAKFHSGICFPLIHAVVSNDSVSGQRRPWSDCAGAPSDLGLRLPHMPEDTVSHVAANLMMDVSSVLLRRGQIRMQVALNQISFEINVQLIILLFF